MQPNQLIWTKQAYTQPPYPLLNPTPFRIFQNFKLAYGQNLATFKSASGQLAQPPLWQSNLL
jgi:hypothetical protein